MDGKRMPKVVEAPCHADMLTDRAEIPPHGLVRQGATLSGDEERGRGGPRISRPHVGKLAEDAREMRPDREVSGLIEFRLADQDHPRTQVHVLPMEGQRFSETEAGAVQEEQ